MDDYKQQIYELRRSLELEKANQEYLSAELEAVHATHERQKVETQRKHTVELDRLREQIEDARNQSQSIEDSYQSQIRSLKLQIESLTVSATTIPEPESIHNISEANLHLEQIQELSGNLQSAQEEVDRLNNDNGSLRNKLENAQEKILCLEETLQSKREEVEERDQTLDQYQDTIQELRSELMQLQADPDPEANKKGNSLFAEVDDQRQQVIHILGAQNKSFKEMKRAYRQSEAEIRQLKEENALMVREIDKCKSLFLNANRSHTDHLQKRNADLQRDANKWKQKVHFLEGQVTDGKVSAILEFCRNETDLVRQELNQCRLQKCELSELLHAAQQELAQWRFQCLKQKCILIDREMRLEANNIAFESRCSVPVDETVPVAVDEWHVGRGRGAGGGGERQPRLTTMEPIIPEIPQIPTLPPVAAAHNPDAPVEKVSIIRDPVAAVEGGAAAGMPEWIKVEIKEEHTTSPEAAVKVELVEEEKKEHGERPEMKQEPQKEQHESHSTEMDWDGAQVKDEDCEILSPQQESVIDLCITVTDVTKLEREATRGAPAVALMENISKEEWMDMSLEVAAEMNVSPGLKKKMDFTTRKLATVNAESRSGQVLYERRKQQRSKEERSVEEKVPNGSINLDFLLDSPNKPQQQQQQPIWLDICSSPEPERNRIEHDDVEANKENEKRTGGVGSSGLSKLKYKPINSRKSILIKSKGVVLDNNHKSVHFATDVKELSGQASNTETDKVVEAKSTAMDRPKKKITVNCITIKSRPAAKGSPTRKE